MGVTNWRPIRLSIRWLTLGLLLWLAFWFSTVTLHAQALPADPDQPCAECHEVENEAWHLSPHATIIDPVTNTEGATCVDCHGEYVEEHPRADMMTLAVDSAICADCHEETFTQWEGSTHAEAEVQCISCHLSHSQELRLTDEALCVSCHQQPIQDEFHTAHWTEDVTCSACHLPGQTMHNALASQELTTGMLTPNHDFVTVAADSCLDCHREDVQQISWANGATPSQATANTAVLTTELQSAENRLYTMGILTPVVLGIGVSLGGFLGIVFMLFAGRYDAKKEEEA